MEELSVRPFEEGDDESKVTLRYEPTLLDILLDRPGLKKYVVIEEIKSNGS